MASISTLTDNFATQDAAKWSYVTGADVNAGQARLQPTAGATWIRAQTNYTVVGASLIVELAQASSDTWVYFYTATAGGNSYSGFRRQSTSLFMFEYISGVSDATGITYNSTSHRWLRFRESAGTILWDTSPDGLTWTNQRSKSAGTSYTTITPELYAESGSGTALLDNFNLPPAATNTGAFFAML